jgi:hypothetical protein
MCDVRAPCKLTMMPRSTMKWDEDEWIDRMSLRQPLSYKSTVWNAPKKSVKQRDAADRQKGIA